MKTNWSYKNFKQGKFTTVVGCILMLAAVYVYITKPDSEVFAMTLLGLGAVAAGLRDPKLPPTSKGALLLLIIALVFLLSGCVTYKKCASKFGTGEMYTVTVRDTVEHIDTVFVKRDSVVGLINVNDLRSGKVDSVTHTSESNKLQVKFWYDKYTQMLRFRANVKPDTVIKKEFIPVEVKADCPETVVLDPTKNRPWHGEVWERYKSFAAYALFLFVIVLIMGAKWKKLTGWRPEQDEE